MSGTRSPGRRHSTSSSQLLVHEAGVGWPVPGCCSWDPNASRFHVLITLCPVIFGDLHPELGDRLSSGNKVAGFGDRVKGCPNLCTVCLLPEKPQE